MKIVWLVNRCPNFIRKKIDNSDNITQGWLDLLGEKLLQSTHEFFIISPYGNQNRKIKLDNGYAYLYSLSVFNEKSINISKNYFKILLAEITPDVIHIHGTEFSHSYSLSLAAKELGLLDKVVISIQGLVSVYAEQYYANLPLKIVRSTSIRDLIRGNIQHGKKDFEKRGLFEKLAIMNVKHIIGRTEWDKACSLQINPEVHYYVCNENMREPFYEGQWNYDECIKHSILVSQSSYPIKGLHTAIKALKILLPKYPDAKIYVTGTDPFVTKFYRIDSYRQFLKKIIIKYDIKDKVIFMGNLNEIKMKASFLKTNVFLMCSSIENSPNALGEAMLLGVPCVSSNVGGVSSMFSHNIDGYLYPFNETNMMAYYISKVFDNGENEKIVKNARKRAQITHDREQNFNNLLSIYQRIFNFDKH